VCFLFHGLLSKAKEIFSQQLQALKFTIFGLFMAYTPGFDAFQENEKL
jgi:hypothetical protein